MANCQDHLRHVVGNALNRSTALRIVATRSTSVSSEGAGEDVGTAVVSNQTNESDDRALPYVSFHFFFFSLLLQVYTCTGVTNHCNCESGSRDGREKRKEKKKKILLPVILALGL